MIYSHMHVVFLMATYRHLGSSILSFNVGCVPWNLLKRQKRKPGAQLWCNDSRMLRFLVWLVLGKQTFSIESALRPSKKGFCLRRRGWMWGIVETEHQRICWEFWPVTCHLLFSIWESRINGITLVKWAFLHLHYKFVSAGKITRPCRCDPRVFCRTVCLHIIWRVVLSFPGQRGCLLWASTSTDLNPYSQSFVPEVLSLRTNIHACINFSCLVHFLKMQYCKTAVVFPP